MTLSYDSPTSIKAFLDAEGLAMSKRFGQNFLIDRNARERLHTVLDTAGPSHVWEIGPGIGSITSILLAHGHRVTAFEIDHGFARVLRALFGENQNFRLVEGDFLKTWKAGRAVAGTASASGVADNAVDANAAAAESSSTAPDFIFGNLPYNAALAIIADLLEEGLLPPRMVFTVQKEAARRIAASPGSKDYSAFSVLCSSVCTTKILYDIGASSFWPQPRVTSSVVALVPRPDPVAASDRKGFSQFARAAFASRRKTLRNNLASLGLFPAGNPAILDEILASMAIPADIRAEALSAGQLATVYFALKAAR
jgi:16S rRNA (adenine1518-N6/adenine1519-N6)-dimethyltransferase